MLDEEKNSNNNIKEILKGDYITLDTNTRSVLAERIKVLLI
jgi:hypothetical protein